MAALNVDDFINTARTQSHTPDTVVDDTLGLTLLNIEYRDWINDIKAWVGEDYFLKEYVDDLVVGNTDHGIDQSTATAEWHDKIVKVGIKFKSTDENYTLCEPRSLSALEYDQEWYKTNQPSSQPFYIVVRDIIRIFPAPTEEVDEGAYMAALVNPIDLVAGGAESSIEIPRQHIKGLFYGLMARMFETRGLLNDQAFYRNLASVEKAQMIKKMGSRTTAPIHEVLPDLTEYE